MPSPFPGVDPYLEDPEIWPDLQHALAAVFPVGLREWLPCIPIPLKAGENELTLDLQFAFNRA